jgi:hypothetical protein
MSARATKEHPVNKPRTEAFDAQVMIKGAAAQERPVLVLVSSDQARARVLARLKTWVTDGAMQLNKLRQEPVEMLTPKSFFCTSGRIDSLYGDRRFHIVNLDD